MTVSNLATVFGPNILQKEKPGEKDASALNFEDSAAIILVLQRLIEHHHSLFMVRGADQGSSSGLCSPLNSSKSSRERILSVSEMPSSVCAHPLGGAWLHPLSTLPQGTCSDNVLRSIGISGPQKAL